MTISTREVVVGIYAVLSLWIVIGSIFLNWDSFVSRQSLHVERLITSIMGSLLCIAAGAFVFWRLTGSAQRSQ